MSDTGDNNGGNGGGDGQGGGGRRPLTLAPRGGSSVSAGTVKQSFSHGRTKTVVVETKRARAPGSPPAGAGAPRPPAPAAPPRDAAPRSADAARAPSAPASSRAGGLSAGEQEARQRALDAARAADQRRTDEQRSVAAEQQRVRDAEARAQEAARAAAAPKPAPVPAPTPAPAVEAQAPAPVARTPAAPAPAAPVAPAAAASPAAAAPAAPVAPRPVTAAAPAAPRPAPAPARPPEPARPFGVRGEVRREDAPRTPVTPRREGPSRTDTGRSENSRLPEGRVYEGPRREGGYGDRPAAGARPAGGPNYGDRMSPRPAGGPGGAPAGGYGDRGPRPGGPSGGYGDRGPRPGGDRPQADRPYGDRGPRPTREGETVRYSAVQPRPVGPRPGGPGAGRPPIYSNRPSAAPSAPEITKTTRTAAPRSGFARPAGRDDDDAPRRTGPGGPGGPGKAAPPRSTLNRSKGTPVRREGRLTIQSASGEGGDRMRSLASVRRAREREREKRRGGGPGEQSRVAREVVVPDAITVQELGQRMAVRGVDIIKYMMRQGAMMTINDVLDADTAELIASEFGHTVKRVSESDVETGFIAEADAETDTLPRPPVVAVMGHVDHGKTSLLDALRTTNVAKGEHGGITQHIGAYQVTTADGNVATFLDTPGHAAFSAMRARGANVGDIVILVVAADDGVKPQTVEAINHAKSAGAPIIVAVNKIDKPDADPTKVVNELLQYEIVAESLGGETQIIEVSATQKLGLDDLLEAIGLQAEVMDLRANPARSAEGSIIEAKLDKGRGPVATVLVDRGTLKRGDIVVAGSAWGKVRALVNERNEQLKEAGPATPVEILGLDQPPSPGDTFAVVENEARARELTEYRDRVRREKQVAPVGAGGSLADMMAKLSAKKVSELPLIVKADVQGSAEAIVTSLEKLGNEEVRARIIHSGAGGITESDVLLAKGANCPILGFNVRASAQARQLAEREGVEIRYYAIIYDLLDDMKGVLSGLLSPIQRETWLGNATLLQVFDITKVGKIAGCRVNDGVVRRGARTRIIRNDVVIMEQGVLQTLKRFKDDVGEVISGQECGLGFQNFQDLKEGDQIECFTLEEVKRTL